VSQSRDTKILIAFVESNSLIPQDDEDDYMRRVMLHGDSDPNPYNHYKKRYKIMEKNSFNLKGLSVVVDYAKNRLFIDQIEFIDASTN